jgi:hypothetical protein
MADPTAWRLAITGDLAQYAHLHEDAQKRADTRAMQQAVHGEKKQVRRLIERAGLGPKIAKAFRGTTDPRIGAPPTLNPRGVTYSKAINKDRKGGPIDVIEVFRHGAVIQGKLYLPAKGIPRGTQFKNYAAGRKLRTVWLHKGRGRPKKFGLLGYVFEGTKLVFTIWSGVRLKKRLGGIDGVFRRTEAGLEARRLRAYEAEVKRIERKAGLNVRLRMSAAG